MAVPVVRASGASVPLIGGAMPLGHAHTRAAHLRREYLLASGPHPCAPHWRDTAHIQHDMNEFSLPIDEHEQHQARRRLTRFELPELAHLVCDRKDCAARANCSTRGKDESAILGRVSP